MEVSCLRTLKSTLSNLDYCFNIERQFWCKIKPTFLYLIYLLRFIHVLSVSHAVCSLFNDAFFSVLDYISSNKGMISKWWIGQYVDGSGRGLIYVLSQHLSGGTDEIRYKLQSE
jgi:hypothetical protein